MSSSPSKSLYPEVTLSNSEANSATENPNSSSSSLNPYVDMGVVGESLFADDDAGATKPTLESSEEVIIKVPGAIVHLIERENSVELACGELTVVGLRQGENIVAVLARVGDEIQWPLAKDEAVVKLDESHYFFSLRVPATGSVEIEDEDNIMENLEILNYGLTIASKGQEDLLRELDGVLERYSYFTVEKVEDAVDGAVDGAVASETSPEELESRERKDMVEESSAAYWTTLAPNVEDYSGNVAKLIAAGSGQLIQGILWCGDVTVDRLKWGNEFLKTRLGPGSDLEVYPGTMKRLQRVKKLTKMSEEVAVGILSGVVKVSGFFTSAIVNSRVGKKFFSLIPGEIVLASLDGFSKVCDAVEVTGRNVMSTSSVVTTELVSQRYGEQAGSATNEGFSAAGHAIGTAWAVLKIRKALNPKSVIRPTTLAKAAAETNSAKLNATSQKSD